MGLPQFKGHLIKLGVLISGRGSNLDAILAAIKSGKLANAKAGIVISSKPGIAGLKIASEKYNVPTKVIPPEGLKGWNYDQKIACALHDQGAVSYTHLRAHETDS